MSADYISLMQEFVPLVVLLVGVSVAMRLSWWVISVFEYRDEDE